MRLRERKPRLARRAGEIIDTPSGPGDQFIDTKELARWLGVSVAWLEGVRSKGADGPPYVKLAPKCVRYRRDAVLRWLEERTRTQTTQ